MRNMGVTARYPTGDSGKELPKARITLALPDPTSPLRERLEREHDRFFVIWGIGIPSLSPFEKTRLTPIFDHRYVYLGNGAAFQEPLANRRNQRNRYSFMYGEQAKIYNFSLRLMDGGENLFGTSFDWLDKIEKFYERFNGQVIADYNMKFAISYKNREYTGVWLNFDIQEESDFDKTAGVTFQMFVLNKETKSYKVNGR